MRVQLGLSRRSILGQIAMPALLMIGSVTAAQAQAVWHFATEYPQSNISGIGLATFARLVSERTNGFVTAETEFESPISSGKLMRAVADKNLTGGDAFAGPMEAIDPLFGLPSLPFVIQSVAAARNINTRARPAYEAALAKRGMKLLYITVWPPTGLWSARKLTRADDIRSLAIRAYDDNSARVMKAAGAKAEYLPFNEAVGKVKKHELNAILTSGDGGAGRKLWDDLSQFTAINYAIPISMMFVRAEAFDALPPFVRERVLDAARETEQRQIDLLDTRTAENYSRMRENGVTITDPPPSEIVSHLKMSAKATIDAWREKVPPGIAQLVDEARQ